MKIGIDISQLAYSNTGVANYLSHLVFSLVNDKSNEYILFYSSMRRKLHSDIVNLNTNKNVQIRKFKFPPSLMDIIWNRLHILPIENLIGNVDLFITSDWTEPPTKMAKKATLIYDMIVFKHPKETNAKIIETQKRKLRWVKKESDVVFCISDSTKKDAIEILNLDRDKVKVIYPGI